MGRLTFVIECIHSTSFRVQQTEASLILHLKLKSLYYRRARQDRKNV